MSTLCIRAFALACWFAGLTAQAPPAPIDVALVATEDNKGAAELGVLLQDAGMRVRRVRARACRPESVGMAHVVLVDWSEDLTVPPALAAQLDRWACPTVFLRGGDAFARAWQLPTAAEIVARDEAQRGPAMQEIELPGVNLVRHGHLFYVRAPVAIHDVERILALLRHAATFVVDRPVVRAVADGERVKRARDLARRLRVDIATLKGLQSLPRRLRGGEDAARDLLVATVLGGPAPDSTANNWQNWLLARRPALHWDDASACWRLDGLAMARNQASVPLRGDQRADGHPRTAEAIDIARRVHARYGGRGFRDLQTFSCRVGTQLWMWDRKRGLFRAENQADVTGRRATPWKAAVLDTWADDNLVWGGGPRPRPRVSARGAYRTMIEMVFLPMLLLEPATSLELIQEDSDDGEVGLLARVAGVGLDIRSTFVLFVDRVSGEIHRVEKRHRGSVRAEHRLLDTTSCGPMLLPSSWQNIRRHKAARFAVEEPEWNGRLPDGMATARDQLGLPDAR